MLQCYNLLMLTLNASNCSSKSSVVVSEVGSAVFLLDVSTPLMTFVSVSVVFVCTGILFFSLFANKLAAQMGKDKESEMESNFERTLQEHTWLWQTVFSNI